MKNPYHLLIRFNIFFTYKKIFDTLKSKKSLKKTEALYGYARIVCKIATDLSLRNQNIYKDYIQFLNAIPLASDCLVKYTGWSM